MWLNNIPDIEILSEVQMERITQTPVSISPPPSAEVIHCLQVVLVEGGGAGLSQLAEAYKNLPV